MLASLQSYLDDVTGVEAGGGGRWPPPSLDAGLSDRLSFMLADDFLCFCLDFLSMRTCRHGNQEAKAQEHRRGSSPP